MASKDRSNKKRTSGEVVSDVQDDVNNEQVKFKILSMPVPMNNRVSKVDLASGLVE